MDDRDLYHWAARLHVFRQIGNVAGHGAAGAGAQLRAATHSHGRQRRGGSSQAAHALLERAAHCLRPEALERGQRVSQSRLDEPRLQQQACVVRVRSAEPNGRCKKKQARMLKQLESEGMPHVMCW